jgi:hypothetical protein
LPGGEECIFKHSVLEVKGLVYILIEVIPCTCGGWPVQPHLNTNSCRDHRKPYHVEQKSKNTLHTSFVSRDLFIPSGSFAHLAAARGRHLLKPDSVWLIYLVFMNIL